MSYESWLDKCCSMLYRRFSIPREKDPFLFAVSSFLMIIYDREMTTQVELATLVYLNSVGSAKSPVLSCRSPAWGLVVASRIPGAANP